MDRVKIRLALLLVAVALVATGCGATPPAAAPTSAPATSAPAADAQPTAVDAQPTAAGEPTAAATEPAPAAASGGVARIAIQTQPGSFNPVLPAELSASIVNAALFAPLTVMNPETFAIEPYLAESWEASEDLSSWTFKLRENAVWHDGEPITAEDVEFTFERILDPEEGATNRRDLAGVESIDVVDEHTVTVQLSGPDTSSPTAWPSAAWSPCPSTCLRATSSRASPTSTHWPRWAAAPSR
jgi:ABC-type transport system substrate-binding protein